MSVIIKVMDVPSKCNMCPFADLDLFGMLWTCKISGGDISEEIFSPPFDFRPNWCPIGEFPESKEDEE